MRQIFFLIILIFVSRGSFAQTKILEYERADSDSESGLIDYFLEELRKEPESKGLIVVYSGEKENDLGTALSDAAGIKTYVNFSNVRTYRDRIFFKIIEGKPALFKEFWIYPKGSTLPDIESKTINLDSLKTSYLYASVCAACEPVVPSLAMGSINLELYSDLLKRYPNYAGLIIINQTSYASWSRNERYQDALRYAITYRNSLIKTYRIRNRISIRISKPPAAKDEPTQAMFYIVPPQVNNLSRKRHGIMPKTIKP